MLMNPILQWLISCAALFIANYLWALHDWYFWDAKTQAWIRKHFKDWHNLKSSWILFLFLSVKTIPLRLDTWKGLIPLVIWLFAKWFSWEFACHSIPSSKKYTGASSQWLGNIFWIRSKWHALLFYLISVSIGLYYIYAVL